MAKTSSRAAARRRTLAGSRYSRNSSAPPMSRAKNSRPIRWQANRTGAPNVAATMARTGCCSRQRSHAAANSSASSEADLEIQEAAEQTTVVGDEADTERPPSSPEGGVVGDCAEHRQKDGGGDQKAAGDINRQDVHQRRPGQVKRQVRDDRPMRGVETRQTGRAEARRARTARARWFG